MDIIEKNRNFPDSFDESHRLETSTSEDEFEEQPGSERDDVSVAGQGNVIVSSSLSRNISIHTFTSGATAIHIKDYLGSNSSVEELDGEAEQLEQEESFGKRSGQNNRRPNDCLVLEPSEMIVIDYPDVQKQQGQHANGGVHPRTASMGRKGIQSMNFDHPPSSIHQPYPSAQRPMMSADGRNISGHITVTGPSGAPASTSTYYYGENGERHLRNPSPAAKHPTGPSSARFRPPNGASNTGSSSSSSTVSAGSSMLSGNGSTANTPTSSLMRHRYLPRRDRENGGAPPDSHGIDSSKPNRPGNHHYSLANQYSLGIRSSDKHRYNGPTVTPSEPVGRYAGSSAAHYASSGALATTHYASNSVSRHGQEPSSSSSSNSVGTLIEEEDDSIFIPPHPPGPTKGPRGSEPLREIETVIHRSEVYLSGTAIDAAGTNGHNGSSKRNGNGYASTRSSTSSTYSGSTDRIPAPGSSYDPDDELAGLPEGNVDSDDDDDESCPSGDSFMELRDCVRDCLEKDPSERNEDDILTLQDFMTHMPAFASLPSNARRELCLTMVFAIVEKAGKIVMNDGEQLDSWCVVVNGEVEVLYPDGSRKDYHLGDSFGVTPTPEAQFNKGTMRTLVDDCQFVLVTQEDFVRIMSRVTESFQRHTDAAGEIVSETERRILDSREGYVLIKGKPEKLLGHLVEERDTVDPYYVEDFLLMYRTFLPNPVMIFEKLMSWFQDPALREKVVRLVLLWVNNHFNDFERNPEMMKLLDQFELSLENENMHNHQALLNIACSVKSQTRTVTYTRSDRNEILHFSILGGYEKGYGIFVSKVDAGSQAEKVGLKRGDEILEVNNTAFQHIPHQKALEILRGTTHLSITVKSNLLRFKEMLAAPERSLKDETSGKASSSGKSKGASSGKLGRKGVSQPHLLPEINPRYDSQPSCPANFQGMRSTSSYAGTMPASYHANRPNSPSMTRYGVPGVIPVHDEEKRASNRLRNLIGKFKMGMSSGSLPVTEESSEISINPDPRQTSSKLPHSRSNPDLSAHIVQGGISQYYQPAKPICPEHVLKIFIHKENREQQRYLTVFKETTAQNVVQLALQEFGMSDERSGDWSLTKVTVTPQGVIKQSRQPDQIQNLAERIDLNSRYYLKRNDSSAPLVRDSDAPSIISEAAIQLEKLNANIIAAQLTLQDFAVFAAIEPTEFVDNLFKIKSAYGWPKLEQFEELVNTEMWWVATEICREKSSAIKRAKLIKKFITIARHCRDFRNFNSMFAILSGLDKPAVRRLAHTWEKVPAKYNKQLKDLHQLFSLARNMSTYRQTLATAAQDPPVIPLFPVIKKDLTFIHEGNPSKSEDLINFEKLRMIAKEIRSASKMASAPFELTSMFEEGEPNEALIHINPYDHSVATMKRTHSSKGPQNRRKLYERALMVRKVKSYLERLDVVANDAELDRMSTECEPHIGSGSTGNVNSKRRMPSPSPSSTSSLSNNSDSRKVVGPKFGVESPQAVQKMMALVENSRLHLPNEKASVVPTGYQRSNSRNGAAPGMAPPGGFSSGFIPPNAYSPGPSPAVQRRNHQQQQFHASTRVQRFPSSSGSNGQASRTPSFGPIDAVVVTKGHGRSQSESMGPHPPTLSVLPVDLTAESSSVTTLLGYGGGRISSTGSVTSTDSAVSQQSSVNISHAISCDSTDSGHASIDAHSSTGSHGPGSPPTQRRSFPPNVSQQNSSAPAHPSKSTLKTSVQPSMLNVQPSGLNGRVGGGKGKAPPPPPGKPTQGIKRTTSHGNGALPQSDESHQISRV